MNRRRLYVFLLLPLLVCLVVPLAGCFHSRVLPPGWQVIRPLDAVMSLSH